MILKELKTNEIEVIQISKKINKNKKQKWEQAKKQNEEMFNQIIQRCIK